MPISNKQYISAVLKKEDDRLTFIASDETLDRMGEVLKVDDWDLSNFKKNPVLLVNHDYMVENIVGAAKRIRVEDRKLLFEPEFHGITEKSREVKEMVEQGYLNTVSVGFMPHAPEKDGQRGKLELFEISFVPVPANPSAERLRAVIAKSVDKAEEIDRVKEWAGKQSETTEVQSVLCSKEKFETQEAAATWCKEHDFRADKADETEESFRFRQFEPSKCQTDSFRTIDLTEGVKAVVCRPKKSAEPEVVDFTPEHMKELGYQLVETEEQFRAWTESFGEAGVLITLAATKFIQEIIAARERAVADLANARPEKHDQGDKGREPKGEHSRAATRAIVRALQVISRESNHALRELK